MSLYNFKEVPTGQIILRLNYIILRTHQTFFKEIILRLNYISLRTHQTFLK